MLLVVAHIGALLLVIDKQNRFVRATYSYQRLTAYKQELARSINDAKQELAAKTNLETAHAYAQQQGMQQRSLKTARILP